MITCLICWFSNLRKKVCTHTGTSYISYPHMNCEVHWGPTPGWHPDFPISTKKCRDLQPWPKSNLTEAARHVGVVDLLTMSISGAKAYQVIAQFLRAASGYILIIMDPNSDRIQETKGITTTVKLWRFINVLNHLALLGKCLKMQHVFFPPLYPPLTRSSTSRDCHKYPNGKSRVRQLASRQ